MIYLDYAATSFIKPKAVYQAVNEAMMTCSANPGRGGHTPSVRAGELVYGVREKLCRLFHVNTPEQFAFFPNTTTALNAGIKGILSPGDHVVVSSMEHNSVMRPLEAMRRRGIISYTLVPADKNGELVPADFVRAMRPNTKLAICTHASNVCGNCYELASISRLVHEQGVYFMADAAQSAGILDIDASQADLLAFPGHKGLYAPQGSGALYVREGIQLNTVTEGGTGSQSELLLQPEDMPDRLESGTLNVPAIAGLGAAVDFILAEGISTIYEHEQQLMGYFTEKMKNMKQVECYGSDNRVAVLALNVIDMDCIDVAEELNTRYGIAVRSGLHCAPAAHRSLGTLKTGCLRFSFGYFTTKKEVEQAVNAMFHIIKEHV